ncbi:MAG: F0F1 ATP synthase subunit alpha [Pelolinea sp.]|nr:F0F1 ATP synthase subunit alpha [Pelolinea sp.]
MKIDIHKNLEKIGKNHSFESFSVLINDHIKEVLQSNGNDHVQFQKTKAIIRSLREKSKEIGGSVHFEEVGTVQHIGNGVATISGLSQAAIDELVDFKNGSQGLILNLQTESLDVVLLGNDEGIQGGSLVTHQNNKLDIPVGPNLLGRTINALGSPIDDGPMISSLERRFIERPAPEITERSPVDTPLQTGTKIIDALFPIGKGQRELIVGDRQTGKTTIAIDAIINQKGKNVICVYVSIGQKKSSLLAVTEILKKNKAFDYSIVIAASPDDPPAQKYIAPFTGMTIAEYFLDQGDDVLVIFDDLSKHADAYRELSLLLRRPPGREAYPGDIFYLHSRLLERACKLNKDHKGGSITAIPILTTQQGNISAYIPTNLISICDGQIVLDRDKFNKVFKPSVNIGTSVSRVGGSAQTKIMRGLANSLKLDLSQFEEVEKFTKFGTELDESTKNMIDRGQRLQEILAQPIHRPFSLSEQVLILYAATHGYLDRIKIKDVKIYEKQLFILAKDGHEKLLDSILTEKVLSLEIEKQIIELLDAFNLEWKMGDSEDE